jgi:hypothetical protein
MRKASIVVVLATLGFVLTGTAEAITFGHRDGGRHPNVGALTKLNGKGNKGGSVPARSSPRRSS